MPRPLTEASSSSPGPSRVYHLLGADAVIALDARRVRVDGENVNLTPIEWRLIELLIEHAGHTVATEELTRLLSTPSRTMTAVALIRHLSNLRQKLGHASIETIRLRGVRLRLIDPPE